jgi:hypothetical protein
MSRRLIISLSVVALLLLQAPVVAFAAQGASGAGSGNSGSGASGAEVEQEVVL